MRVYSLLVLFLFSYLRSCSFFYLFIYIVGGLRPSCLTYKKNIIELFRIVACAFGNFFFLFFVYLNSITNSIVLRFATQALRCGGKGD